MTSVTFFTWTVQLSSFCCIMADIETEKKEQLTHLCSTVLPILEKDYGIGAFEVELLKQQTTIGQLTIY